MRKVLFGMLFLGVFFIAGCASMEEPAPDGDPSSYLSVTEGVGGVESESLTFGDDGVTYYSIVTEGEGSGDPAVYTQTPRPDAGLLTASEWKDLENYEFYLSLFESNQDGAEGIFEGYYDNGYLDSMNMVKVHIHDGDQNIMGARIALQNDSQDEFYVAITDVFGNAYLFPNTSDLDSITSISVRYDVTDTVEAYTYSTENNEISLDMDLMDTREDVIEIMFVIDTTGSMSDELRYLQSEIDNVIQEVSNLNPNSVIKLALLFYRDQNDAYVTRYYDFTTDIEEQRENLLAQNANGGGDFPEAVSVALDEAVNKNWSNDNTTKLLFHVLDAPPHNNQEAMTRYVDALEKASELGIRMIPIASSGIDKYTEYLLRNEAMYTGGTYVYLTNDSGIGGDHIEASVGDTDVELLNGLLIRLIVEYHTGVMWQVEPYDTTGDQE